MDIVRECTREGVQRKQRKGCEENGLGMNMANIKNVECFLSALRDQCSDNRRHE